LKILVKLMLLVGLPVVTATAYLSSQTGIRPELSTLSGSVFGISPLVLVVLTVFAVSAVFGLALVSKGSSKLRSILIVEVFAGSLWQIIPLLKGYYFFGAWDPSFHIGVVRSILQTTSVSGYDPYPLLHAVGAISNLVTHLPVLVLAPLFGEVFYFLYLGGSYVFVNSVIETRSARDVSYLLIPALAIGVRFVPEAFALSLVPLLLYLGMGESGAMGGIFVILVSAEVLAHPAVAIFTVATLLAWNAARRKPLKSNAIIGMIIVLAWIGYNLATSTIFAGFFENFGPGKTSAYQVVAGAFPTRGILQSAQILLLQTGVTPVLALLEILVTIRFRLVATRRGIILFLLISSALIFLSSLLFSQYFYGRFILFEQLAALLGVGLVFEPFRTIRRTFGLGKIFAVLFLFIIAFSTMITSYPSSFTYSTNDQVTQNQYVSGEWVFGHLMPNTIINEPLFSPLTLWDLQRSTQLDPNLQPFEFRNPSHFSIAPENRPQIVISSLLAEITYLSSSRLSSPYNASDYSRVFTSSQFDLVYASSDSDVFSVISS
jgi:hypothetical protein